MGSVVSDEFWGKMRIVETRRGTWQLNENRLLRTRSVSGYRLFFRVDLRFTVFPNCIVSVRASDAIGSRNWNSPQAAPMRNLLKRRNRWMFPFERFQPDSVAVFAPNSIDLAGDCALPHSLSHLSQPVSVYLLSTAVVVVVVVVGILADLAGSLPPFQWSLVSKRAFSKPLSIENLC